MDIHELIQRLEAEAQRRDAALTNDVNRRRPDAAALLAVFEECADRLPASLRLVAQFAVAEGMSISQTAAALGLKRNTVRSHLRRLRALARRNHAFLSRFQRMVRSTLVSTSVPVSPP
jgi:DNA-directed RNA polymerase specialized sigma24 family protein